MPDTATPTAVHPPHLFCDGCGYSLIGLTTPRCPECGRDFNPKELATPQIPWLRRKRIGTLNAYLQTVALASFRPAHFACRLSLRPPSDNTDARLFRKITLRLATASFAIVIVMLPLVTLETENKSMFLLFWGGFFTLLGISLFHLFIHLATFPPRFVWPNATSTAKHYASAPLAFLPFPAATLAICFHILLRRHFNLDTRFLIASTAISVLWIAWTCLATIALAKASGEVKDRRLFLLAIYQPLHWLLALVLSIVFLYAVAMVLHFLLPLLMS